MIESAEQAREVVRSVLYPPRGVRGVGTALACASKCNGIADYLQTANDEACLLLQVESMAGIAALDDILAIERVDGVFVGPADLAADLGYLGKPGASEAQVVVNDVLRRIKAAGKAAGILTSDHKLAQGYAETGTESLAVGSDVGILRVGLTALGAAF